MRSKTAVGLIGVLGIWLTAGLALPFVNVLGMFTPEQLMIFRGFLTALMALVVLRGKVWTRDKYTYLLALTLPFATLGLFEGIRHWGAGPTIIVVTATPLVNFAISLFFGGKVSRPAVVGLSMMLAGVVIARWGGEFQWAGLLWSLFGTLMNGILYEFFSRAEKGTWQISLKKSFYSCVGMGVLGLILSARSQWTAHIDVSLSLTLLGFAFVGGFLYWLANLVAFENLPKNEASILAQGETLAVIVGAYFLLGESLTTLQWFGVFAALYGAWYLSKRIPAPEAQTIEPARST